MFSAVRCLALLLAFTAGCIAPASGEVADDAAAWQQLDELLQRRSGVTRWTGTFVQERVTPLLDEPLVSTGTIRVADGVVRFDTADPYPSVMVVRDGVVTFFYPDDATVELFTADARTSPLGVLARGQLGLLQEHFRLSFLESDEPGTARFELTPLPPETGGGAASADTAERITITLGDERADLRAVAFIDGDGQSTDLRFEWFEAAPELTADELDLKLPEGVVVHDFTQPRDEPAAAP